MIALDLNNPEIQANLLALQKDEAWAVLKTLRLQQAMDWQQLVLSKGTALRTDPEPSGPLGPGALLPAGEPQLAGAWPGALATGSASSRCTPTTTLPTAERSAAPATAGSSALLRWAV